MLPTAVPHGARARVAPGLSATSRPLAAWGCVAGVVVVELLVLSVRFDVKQLLAAAGLGGFGGREAMSSTRIVALGSLAAMVATAVFGGEAIAGLLAARGPRPGLGRMPWYLAGQLAAYSAFVAIASRGLEASGPAHPVPAWCPAAWLISGVAALGLAAAAALPPSLWWPLARRIPGAIAAGLATGVVASASGLATSRFWGPLAEGTMRLSAALLGLIHPTVVCRVEERILGTPGFTVTIAPACSGYEGIGLILAFLAGFLWFDRSRLLWPRAWLLLPIGLAAIWLLNAARIAALVTIGAWVSPELAADGFHSQAGSLGFTALALLLVAAGRSRAFRVGEPGSGAIEARVNPAVPYLLPQLVLIAATMVGAALTVRGGPDRAYPLRVVAAGLAFWALRGRYRGLALGGSWVAVGAGVLVFAAWMALEPASAATAGPLAGMSASAGAAWLACRVIGSVVAVPIAEELAFRGFLARRLASVDFEAVNPRDLGWLAVAVSSAAFGALHGRWLAGCLAGVVYALAYRRRGALIDPILAHAVTNAMIAGYVLATGRWAFWS